MTVGCRYRRLWFHRAKRGDGYIRLLMIHGARAVVGWRKHRPLARDPWLGGLLARRHVNVATVAFANKSARIAWR
jgi:transposase